MSHQVHLRPGTVALNTRNLREALEHIGKAHAVDLHLTDEGTVAFGVSRSAVDRRAPAVELTFAAGALTLSAPPAWAPLADWLGHQLTVRLAAALVTAHAPVPTAQVLELLQAHEQRDDDDDDRFDLAGYDEGTRALLDLVRAGRIELSDDDPTQLAQLVQRARTSEALYEALLEADAVADVFMSESEFVAALNKRLGA